MDSYEQEELERLKEWWQNNGSAIMLGLFIGVTGVLGWRLRENHLEKEAQAASDIFQELAEAAQEQDSDTVSDLAESIAAEYPDSVYGSFIDLTRSNLAVSDGNLAEAKDSLQEFLDSSPVPLLADLARVRLARILIAGRELAAAEEVLSKVENESSVVLELRGDLRMLQSRIEEAVDIYRQSYLMSKQEQEDNLGLPESPWIELKLESLGIDPEEIGEAG